MSQAEDDAPPRQTAPEDIVPFPNKVAYGAGAFVNNLLSAAIGNMMIVLNLGFGMNPALVGALGGLPRIVDAVTDPLMGHISDNTRSRWGRRRPYIFVGAIVVSVVFFLLWQMPEGDTRIVTWGQDGVAQQWNADEGEAVGDAMGHDSAVGGAAISTDSERVLTWSDDDTARLWDAGSGEALGSPLRHDGDVRGAVFTNGEVLTWSADGTARLWDGETGAAEGEPLAHDGPVNGAAVDGETILTWSEDGTARLWKASSQSAIGSPLRHDAPVVGGTFNGPRVVTWSEDGTARSWDAQTGEAVGTPIRHDGPVTGVIARGERVLTRSGNTARLWQVASGRPASPAMTHDGTVNGALFLDDNHVVTWSDDQTARVWSTETGEATVTLQHDGPVTGLIVDEGQLVTWSESGQARIWDAESGEAVGSPMEHGGPVTGARLNRTQTRVLTWSEDGTARIWHPDTGEAIGKAIALGGPVAGAIFNDGYMESFYFYWFLIGSVLFFISYTMWATPWVALGFELTPDYYERTRLMGVQFFIGQIPYLIAPWFLAFMTWSYFSSQAQGASVLALLVALTAVTLGVIPAIFLRERPLPPVEASEDGGPTGVLGAIWNFVLALARTMTSGPFLLLAAATFLVFNGFQLIAAFQSYVLIYYVMGGDQEGGSFWLGWTGTTQIIATFGVIPLVTWLANRIGKRRAFLLSTGIATVGYGLKWFCYSQTTPWLILVPTPLIAFSLGGLFTLMPSMIADVVDYDELKTHQRREGMFGSVYWLMVKVGVSFALIAGGLLLNATGFKVELGGDQSVETLLWLRIYDVTVPMLTSLLAMLAMYYYPLVEERALEIRAELDARHAAAAEAAT